MSILLEALRKSEKSQQSAEPLTIHSEQQLATASRSGRKGPLLLLLLLIVVLLAAWLVWRHYQQVDEAYQPPVTLAAGKDQSAESPPAAGPAADTASVVVKARVPATGSAGKSKKEVAKTVKDASKTQRTPVEKFQQAGNAASKPDKGVANPPAAKPVKTKSVAAKTATAKVAVPKPQAGKQSTQPATDAIPIVNKTPAPISYWELPDAVRSDVPDIKFSVLVYSEQPANRFVLANGQRLAEGDSFQQGLVVEEIRRDGVIFSFRLYRFLVEK